MVWGMVLPKGFGEYWPSGEFEYDAERRETGWYGRLTDHYLQQTPGEQKRLFQYPADPADAARRYGTYPVSKFKKEPGWSRGEGGEPPLGEVFEHEVPRSFDMDKTYNVLASLIKLNDKIIAVDDKLKEIIQRREPKTHEFFAFEMRMRKKKIYVKKYYILRVCQYYEAFSRENTSEASLRILPAYGGVPELIRLNHTKEALNGLAMDKSVFGGAHLWRDRTFEEELTCFSDELVADIKHAGLRLPKHFTMREV